MQPGLWKGRREKQPRLPTALCDALCHHVLSDVHRETSTYVLSAQWVCVALGAALCARRGSFPHESCGPGHPWAMQVTPRVFYPDLPGLLSVRGQGCAVCLGGDGWKGEVLRDSRELWAFLDSGRDATFFVTSILTSQVVRG